MIEKAHRVGAHVILDIYQAAGVIPIDLHGARRGLRRRRIGQVAVRRARRGLPLRAAGSRAHARARVRRLGGARRPVRLRGRGRFAMPMPPERFQSGTPNVPALYSARAGYEIVAEIGVDAIRQKSLRPDAAPDRARVGRRLPRQHADADAERAGAVIVDVPDGYAVTQELIRREVIVDYRPGAGHPHVAALLQYGSGDRSRHGCADGDCGGARVMRRAYGRAGSTRGAACAGRRLLAAVRCRSAAAAGCGDRCRRVCRRSSCCPMDSESCRAGTRKRGTVLSCSALTGVTRRAVRTRTGSARRSS